MMYANGRNASFLLYLQQKPGTNISESFSHSILISPEREPSLSVIFVFPRLNLCHSEPDSVPGLTRKTI